MRTPSLCESPSPSHFELLNVRCHSVWRYWPSLFITGRDGAPLPHPGLTSQVGIIGFADLCNYTNGNWFEWDPGKLAI